ncbi:tRNA pseudouridine synthase 1 [Knufia fluminis]|uniref:tRNA pseudouridine synthase 1 n=1 Tax=Knufia fluminis TaxID=191047 RepID=A0AAN8EMQ0_9EURO|nr:tRNA pseudouridine synthase 1 [Knufia fluminis]
MAPTGSAGPSGSPSRSSHRSDGDSSSHRGSGPKSGRGRGGGGSGRGRNPANRGGKKRDMGRNEWSKTKPDKRAANIEAQASKRQKLNDGEAAPLPVYATQFDAESIAAEERRPKKKVAVLIGYSGTGYKGMQLAPDQKTIEGDLFKAFVAVGAISKANADDPKKSSFVRCARTDKGVHAAGNIISLKLIVEEEDIVKKINEALTPQIRVWGFERTNNSFSSYQLCDSRIYEYLLPTHSLLPPHPKSFLGRKCREWAEKKGEVEQWEQRQEEVEGYWEKVDEEMVKPILEEYPEDIRDILEKALWLTAEYEANKQGEGENKQRNKTPKNNEAPAASTEASTGEAQEAADVPNENSAPTKADSTNLPTAEPQIREQTNGATEQGAVPPNTDSVVNLQAQAAAIEDTSNQEDAGATLPTTTNNDTTTTHDPSNPLSSMTKDQRIARRKLIDEAVKRLRTAYVTAKRQYRIPQTRKQRLQDILNLYLGTRNFHNFTIQKTFRDPSAKRVIKTFNVNFDPILIDGTEWLSLKVHGQSFMMHQIRKMVAMAALIVRCGCDPQRLVEAYGPSNFSIPKAPSLGLLLERPVFDSYNKRAKSELSKEPISFDKYTVQMDAFKQKFIYERMYHDEEEQNVFGNFFNHVDNFPSSTFLFVTSGGLEASGEVDGVDGVEAGIVGKREGGGKEGEKKKVNLTELDSEDEEVGVRDNAGDEG